MNYGHYFTLLVAFIFLPFKEILYYQLFFTITFKEVDFQHITYGFEKIPKFQAKKFFLLDLASTF